MQTTCRKWTQESLGKEHQLQKQEEHGQDLLVELQLVALCYDGRRAEPKQMKSRSITDEEVARREVQLQK